MQRSKNEKLLSESVEDSFFKYSDSLSEVIKRCSKGSVHDLRVSARRILAAADLFGPNFEDFPTKKFQRLLKKRLELLSPLRDLQVQMAWVKKLKKNHPELNVFLKVLRTQKKKKMKRIKKKLLEFRSDKLQKLIRLFMSNLEGLGTVNSLPEETKRSILTVIDEAFDTVVNRRQNLARQRLETIHKMRVSFKKFRYMVELLSPLLVGIPKKPENTMRAFQAKMGEIQDLNVLVANLRKHLPKKKKKQRLLEQLLGKLMTRKMSLVDDFVISADEIFSFWHHAAFATPFFSHSDRRT